MIAQIMLQKIQKGKKWNKFHWPQLRAIDWFVSCRCVVDSLEPLPSIARYVPHCKWASSNNPAKDTHKHIDTQSVKSCKIEHRLYFIVVYCVRNAKKKSLGLWSSLDWKIHATRQTIIAYSNASIACVCLFEIPQWMMDNRDCMFRILIHDL